MIKGETKQTEYWQMIFA